MRGLRKSLRRLLSPLHHSYRGTAWGTSKTCKGTAGATWPRGMASVARRLLRGKRLARPKLGLGSRHERMAVRKGGPRNETKEDDVIESFGVPPDTHGTIQVDVEEAEIQRFLGRDVVLRSRRTSQRVSVTTLPTRHQKVDGLVETMADRSAQLLARRRAELEQCEGMGARILDTSRQFQRVTRKGARKHWWRNSCILCTCCC
ncbi:hypothetical protein AAFF_G00234930 [Aldrovandia affinis]|uniref:V-SNARE coiled-coil homology domain-containing protein n=1 Tax=Aldrovandia affinis TaxID=143900 RepID=A0AAD7SV80_9TELE|nr:hypothetical protein AAFF_G00234930 [Aldrovandia affinis]